MSGNPETAELLCSVHRLRGSIISSYAHVEFLFAELNLRCRALPDYAEIAAGFPYRLEKKIDRVKELVRAPGPLRAYGDELLTLVDGISAYEEQRHFMAHGLMVVSTREMAPAPIIFRMYRPAKGGQEEYGAIETDVNQLENLEIEIAEYARRVVALVARIFRELSLGPPPLA